MVRLTRAALKQQKEAKLVKAKAKPEKKPKKRGRGRPSYEPNDKDRKRIRNLVAANYAQAVIAEDIGQCLATLKKYYPNEFAKAKNSMFALAIGGLRDGLIKKKPWAICFYLKTQGKGLGWVERSEHTGKDGSELFKDMDLSKLTDEKFKQLQELLKEAGAPIKG